MVLEDRALKATRDDREAKWIVEDILVADMLSSLLVELRFDLA